MIRNADFYARLYRQNERHMKFGLEAIGEAIRLDRLSAAYPHCLVAGTNGKGQVSAIMSNACSLLGFRAGLFTSPHLVEFRERIRVDGKLLNEDEVVDIGSRVLERFGGEGLPDFSGLTLTYFECCLMMALYAFRAHSVEFGVFETGLGGRLDATNALDPNLSVITSIGRDHEEYLGSEIPRIAREKAGIMRSGCPVVCGRSAREVLMQEAQSRDCSSFDALGCDFDWCETSSGIVMESRFGRVAMHGAQGLPDFGRDNAAVAFFALLKAEETGLISGNVKSILEHLLEHTRWVGRMWRCSDSSAKRFGAGGIVLDGAHNPDGVRAFIRAVKDDSGPKSLVVNSCSDKALESMYPQYLEAFDTEQIFVVPVLSTARACKPHDYCVRLGLPPHRACDTLARGIERAAKLAGRQGTVYISGSLYLVGEAIELLGEQESLASTLY